MSSLTCQNCGLAYDSQEELKKHQAKFCVGSNYEDVHKIENRFNQLSTEKPGASPSKYEIQQYVKGYQADVVPLGYNDILGDDRFNHNSVDARLHRANLENPQDLLQQAEQLKIDRAIQRQLKSDDEKDVLSLLQELETKKERELRAHIEKEEIFREIKRTDENQLGYVANQKKSELQKLAAEREAVRVREQSYMDEISKMEATILEQERFFKQQRESVGVEDPERRNQRLKEVREKELKMAQDRAQQVAAVKVERERLERERQRIMQELDNNKNKQAGQGQGSRGGFRENAAAKRVGSALSGGGFNPQRVQALEPSLKDKLVADQVRLNQLKQQQQKTMDQAFTDVDEIDVLEREMKNQPNLYDGLRNMQQEYQSRSTPNKARNLQAIQNRLEYEGGAAKQNNFRTPKPPLPSKQVMFSPPQGGSKANQTIDDNLMNKLDDLEGLLLGGNQSIQVNSMQELPQRNFQAPPPRRGLPPNPTGPSSGFPGVPQYPPIGAPTPFFPQDQLPSAPFGSSFAPPQMGFNQQQPVDVYPFSTPFADPAMAQLATMMQSQDEENKKLREVLENFAKNTSTYDNLEQQLRQHDNEIKTMADGKMMPRMHVENMDQTNYNKQTEMESMDPQIVFPDEFAFRQNDQRADDLEVEERALMNLAAQEYDQLRVIQRLPKNSDLYEYKLKQYKELSAMRTEVEKVLQEQRLEKIRRDFEKQKMDEDRQLRHVQWMEQQKRQIVDGRVNAPPQQQYSPDFDNYQRPPVQQRSFRQNEIPQQPLPGTDQPVDVFDDLPPPNFQAAPPMRRTFQEDADPNDGTIMISYDVLFGLPRRVNQLQVVARTLAGKLPIGEPVLFGPVGAEPDALNRELNKILYNQRQILPRNVVQKPVRLILELQAPDPQQQSGVTGAGWTFIDIFHNGDVLQPAKGLWKLPIYSGLTSPDAATTGGKGLLAAPGLALCMRIGEPGDSLFSGKADHTTTQQNYTVPKYHEQAFNQAAQRALLQQQQVPVQPPAQAIAQKPPPPVQQRDPNYRNNGIRVRIHFLMNKVAHQGLSMRYSIYQGSQVVKDNKGQMCSKNLPVIPDGNLVQVKEGQFLDLSANTAQVSQSGAYTVLQDAFMRSVTYELIFERDFYKLYWDKQRSENIVLTAELFAKIPGKNGPQPVAFSGFELCEKESGKIASGLHVEQLKDTASQQYLPGEFIGFTLSDPKQAEPVGRQSPPQQQSQPSQINDIGMDDQQQQILAQKPPSERPFTGEISEQLIKQEKRQWDPKTIATLNEDIDIYIDAARHLPDNVTITRVNAKVVDVNFREQTAEINGLSEVENSTLRNQIYGMKLEIRPKKTKLSPTSLLYITIETLDISNNETRVVGKTVHPLFVHATKGDKFNLPVVSEKATDPSLYLGSYQVGIYSIIPNQSAPFTYERVMYSPRVPTATLLIRVMNAPLDPSTGKSITISQLPPAERKAAMIPPPQYKEGIYYNGLLQVSPTEQVAINLRRRRANPPLKRVVEVLLISSGVNPTQISEEDLVKTLESMTRTTPKSSLLDLNFHSQYEPSLGFRVSVEAVHDNKIKAFFAVLASVIPPASYYDPNRVGNPRDAFTFTEPDMELKTSTNASFQFNEGDAVVKGYKPTQPGMSVLFDIKAYMPDKDEFVDYGFTICPVLTTQNTDADENTTEYYVSSGVFSLPVYKGKPSSDTIEILKSNNDPYTQLDKMRLGKQLAFLDTCSIIVKVVDTQREYHFGAKTIEQETPSVAYIKDQNLKKTYTFKQITGGVFSKPTQLKELVPKAWKADREGFKKHLRTKFKEFMGLGRRPPANPPADVQGEQQIQQ